MPAWCVQFGGSFHRGWRAAPDASAARVHLRFGIRSMERRKVAGGEGPWARCPGGSVFAACECPSLPGRSGTLEGGQPSLPGCRRTLRDAGGRSAFAPWVPPDAGRRLSLAAWALRGAAGRSSLGAWARRGGAGRFIPRRWGGFAQVPTLRPPRCACVSGSGRWGRRKVAGGEGPCARCPGSVFAACECPSLPGRSGTLEGGHPSLPGCRRTLDGRHPSTPGHSGGAAGRSSLAAWARRGAGRFIPRRWGGFAQVPTLRPPRCACVSGSVDGAKEGGGWRGSVGSLPGGRSSLHVSVLRCPDAPGRWREVSLRSLGAATRCRDPPLLRCTRPARNGGNPPSGQILSAMPRMLESSTTGRQHHVIQSASLRDRAAGVRDLSGAPAGWRPSLVHGLDDRQIHAAPSASALSLAWVLKHLTVVQQNWLDGVLAAPPNR